MLWWIWASQVVYNVRFRRKDWVHRIFAILQFGVFGTLATFTRNFNIFAGLKVSDVTGHLDNPVDFKLSTNDFNSVFASSLRQERLPILNAKGISIVLGFSRLFLLVQYAIGQSLGRFHRCRLSDSVIDDSVRIFWFRK